MVQSDRDAFLFQEWIDENAFVFYEWANGGKERNFIESNDNIGFKEDFFIFNCSGIEFTSVLGDKIKWITNDGWYINRVSEKELGTKRRQRQKYEI